MVRYGLMWFDAVRCDPMWSDAVISHIRDNGLDINAECGKLWILLWNKSKTLTSSQFAIYVPHYTFYQNPRDCIICHTSQSAIVGRGVTASRA